LKLYRNLPQVVKFILENKTLERNKIFFLTFIKFIYNKLYLSKVKKIMDINIINILLVLIIVEVIINTSRRRGS
jgi:hypothetical protein